MSTALLGASTLTFLLVASPLPQVAQHEHPASGEKLGTVHFVTSCKAEVQAPFDRAMALLHSFEFGQAIDAFNAVLKVDPACGMASWGLAMARWTNPFVPSPRPTAQLQQGLAFVEDAQRRGAPTPREKAYITAVSKLYVDYDKTDQRTRQLAYEKAMADLAAAYPDDREATIFYALSLAATALPTDKTYANQLKAGALLEKVAKEQPNHPGIVHYIIHSYDAPALADRAVDAAHRYATIAPSAPHALHMPSHTFTRVGAWQDSIDTNIASAEAARRIKATSEELHATDYMMYAYLQTGQDTAAEKVMRDLPDLAARLDVNATTGAAPGFGGIYALAAVPARWTLERGDWKSAAALPLRPSSYPYTDAMIHFARAVGAARSGALADARASVNALAEIRDKLAQAKEVYWTEIVDIQRQGAAAFLALAEGKSEEALKLMRETADREDRTDKNAITPGPLAPARELLGEMLLDLKRPAEALKEFQATLKKEPNRFRATYGAAKAARLAGDTKVSRTYYAQLLKICERGDKPGRPELVEARQSVK